MEATPQHRRLTETLRGHYITTVTKKWYLFLREPFLRVARALGTEIVDARTGERLGRAFLFCWAGRVWIVGLQRPVCPVFLPQQRLTYWRQELGFATHPEPDFPHEARP